MTGPTQSSAGHHAQQPACSSRPASALRNDTPRLDVNTNFHLRLIARVVMVADGGQFRRARLTDALIYFGILLASDYAVNAGYCYCKSVVEAYKT